MRKGYLAAVWLGLFMALAVTAQARMFVVASDAPEYPAKKIIEPGETLKLPPGKRMTVMLPDGTTRALTSADNGPVAAILQPVKPVSWWQDLMDAARSGGGSSRPGSVRSVSPRPAVFSVDGQTGPKFRLCVEPSTQPVITRDRTDGNPAVTILAEKSGQQATVAFAAGQPKLAWPAGIDIVDGQTYRITPASTAAMVVEARVVAPGLTGEAKVRALGAAGCTQQAAAALQALAK